MTVQQQQWAGALGAGSCLHYGPEDDLCEGVNWGNDLLDAADDPGDDEAYGDPVDDGFEGGDEDEE